MIHLTKYRVPDLFLVGDQTIPREDLFPIDEIWLGSLFPVQLSWCVWLTGEFPNDALWTGGHIPVHIILRATKGLYKKLSHVPRGGGGQLIVWETQEMGGYLEAWEFSSSHIKMKFKWQILLIHRKTAYYSRVRSGGGGNQSLGMVWGGVFKGPN